MKVNKVLVSIISIFIMGFMLASPVLAAPSDKFSKRGDEIYDSFSICRNRSTGEDGFMQITEQGFNPIIARESLGDNIDVAWELGRTFAEKYPEPKNRAQQIFYFVRNKVIYTSDIDEFGYQEFAQNADELAGNILENGVAGGDCEDAAILLAVIYKAAGFRSAIVLAPEHAAALVHLPGYNEAAHPFTLEKESGWVWAEATGRTNPLGWFPSSLVNKPMAARELSDEAISRKELTYALTSVQPASTRRTFSFTGISPFFTVIFMLWLLSSMRRPVRRRRHR
ncbi:transglutaminase-like domain-containing protein [Chloroflexota bacterium]